MYTDFKIELEQRTKQFAVNVIKTLKQFNVFGIDRIVQNQVVRSSTSIGANYREANRAESRVDFIHKIGVVEKEAAETQYWFEIIIET